MMNSAPVLRPHRLVPKDVLNIEGALYFCTFFLGIVNSLAVQPVLAAERTVFVRERASRMYSCVPYALSLVRDPRFYTLTVHALRAYTNECAICALPSP